MERIAVIGLGYVGLPLALQFSRSGVQTLGLDIDASKVADCNAGKSYIMHIPSAAIAEQVKQNCFEASTDFARVREVSSVILCLPTPLKPNRQPDLSYITKTAKTIAPHLQPETLVVLESTTYPGTTDGELRTLLEEGSGLKAGRDFYLAYSPEREDPGNSKRSAATIPKVVGGYTPKCLERALALYGQAIPKLVPVSSCRVAEAAKLLENIFRSVNIALVNELKVVYAAMGIDIWEVIAAASTKPFGYMAFYPGPGLGGHCIPIDPFYLSWKAKEYGQETRFIELAGEINTRMPEYVMQRLEEALGSGGRKLKGSKILVLGLAYKADVDDTRESPALALLQLLKKGGAEAAYYDPHVQTIPATRSHPQWTGLRSVSWDKEVIGAFNAVVIVTAHARVDYQQLADWSQCIVDTRNIMASVKTKPGTVWKA